MKTGGIMPNKGGRPKLENPKTEPFGFRATKDEAKQIKAKAKIRGISPGEFCRVAALGKKLPAGIVPELNRKSWMELSRIGNNLNQIAKNLNQGGGDSGLVPVLEDLKSQIQQLQLKIIEAEK